jgi:flagellar motility protein MotE (MotC chaperone)
MLLPSPADASQDRGGDETETLPDVLAALQAREAEIERRERALAERQRALEIAREEVRANLAALADAEAALRETIALADGAAQDDLDRLTRMYETMKPKEAAALFETMDPTFAAGFIAQMSPAAAGAIMEGLPPEIAYTVSLVLAGRNMDVPSE